MRPRLALAPLSVVLLATPLHAQSRWSPISGDATTKITADGDLRAADGATVRTTAMRNGGAITVVDAADFRGHDVELSAEIDVEDGGSASLWLRADGAEPGLAFATGADMPVRGNGARQTRRLRMYVPLASASLVLGVVLQAQTTSALHGLRLRALPQAPSSSNAHAVLSAMLDAAQTHALASSRVDWPALRARLLTDPLASQPTGEAYTRFRDIARALGDRHSFATPPVDTARYAAQATPGAPLRSGIREGVAFVAVPGLRGTDAAAGARFSHELCAALSSLRTKAVHGWIVDLRGNDGGNMWPMLAGLSPLIGSARPGSFRFADGRLEPWRAEPAPGCAWTSDAPVAVLIGPRTRSSGEAVAIAFRGRPRTRFFGASTAGLSTSNQGFALPDGGAAWITTSVDVDRTGMVYPSGLQPDETTPAGGDATDAAAKWLLSTAP